MRERSRQSNDSHPLHKDVDDPFSRVCGDGDDVVAGDLEEGHFGVQMKLGDRPCERKSLSNQPVGCASCPA
jgi:hypothetical protein